MRPAKTAPAFEKFVGETIDEGVAYLSEHGWLDSKTGGPDVGKIRSLLGPQEVQLPAEVDVTLTRCMWNAPAHEYRGNLTTASAWYDLGQHGWRGGRTFAHVTDPVPAQPVREAAAISQLPAAVCADRVGQTQRALDLYRWAAENYTLTEAEIEYYGRSHQIQAIWEILPMRAYALACVEDWPGALAAAEVADRWAKKDRRAQTSESYQLQLQLLPVLLALPAYKLAPNAENRQKAQALLDLKAITSRNASERLLCYFYLYNLRARFGRDLWVRAAS